MHAYSPAVCALKTRSNKQRVFILCEKELQEIKIRIGDEPIKMEISQRASDLLRVLPLRKYHFQLQINYWCWKSCSFHKAFDIQAWGSKFSHHPQQHAQQVEQGFKPSSGESDRDSGILGVHCPVSWACWWASSQGETLSQRRWKVFLRWHSNILPDVYTCKRTHTHAHTYTQYAHIQTCKHTRFLSLSLSFIRGLTTKPVRSTLIGIFSCLTSRIHS